MNKKIRNVLIILGIVLAVLIIGYYTYMSGPQLVSAGSSRISANPDMISVYVNAEGRDVDMQKSQEKSLEVANKFLLELKPLNIPDEDVELSNYNTYLEQDWRTGRDIGYVTSQQMIVKISNFSQVLFVIKSATNSGALVSQVNFELSSSKQNEYKINALKEATEDARNKANAIANGLGKSIGKVVSVQSQDFYYSPSPYYLRMDTAVGNAEAEKAAVSISPQDLEVTASVSVTYAMTLF